MSVGSQLSIISNIIDSAIDDHIAIANTFIDATLTAQAQHILNADSDLSITASFPNQISSQFFVQAQSAFTATDPANVSQGYPAQSQLSITTTFTAKVKKSNQYTDHDVIFFGQVLPRRWYSELSDQRWVAEIKDERNWVAELLTKRWGDGILEDRNKFGTISSKRWEGTLQ
jgi:hypothetical protein